MCFIVDLVKTMRRRSAHFEAKWKRKPWKSHQLPVEQMGPVASDVGDNGCEENHGT